MEEQQQQKYFDLRRLIGILLTLYGIVLGGYGLIFNPQTDAISFNIDLWWGLLMLVVGVIFLLLSLKAPKVDEEEE
ncbi:hypothetical protein JOD43_003174 [Pullulanibacillus pueri]|uniref:Uncharacterized protein n=1 Tax=Pullulanibacillus pueri TaxID=1437324 RepID=A0A8J3ENA0_9BACL|nr:hypothetical protein [Pullulanibacillus pueri]MBM7682995.1 hypothetical protein [Pullulanibacillus pueri]GGH85922.1 hypothetical protein GCM10007096_32430 [Pullulanibacillus pueri]